MDAGNAHAAAGTNGPHRGQTERNLEGNLPDRGEARLPQQPGGPRRGPGAQTPGQQRRILQQGGSYADGPGGAIGSCYTCAYSERVGVDRPGGNKVSDQRRRSLNLKFWAAVLVIASASAMNVALTKIDREGQTISAEITMPNDPLMSFQVGQK